jgi:hypothetical protein
LGQALELPNAQVLDIRMSSMEDAASFLTNITAGKLLKRVTLRVPNVNKDILEGLLSTLSFAVDLLEFRANKMVGNFNLIPSKELDYELFACTDKFKITYYSQRPDSQVKQSCIYFVAKDKETAKITEALVILE